MSGLCIDSSSRPSLSSLPLPGGVGVGVHPLSGITLAHIGRFEALHHTRLRRARTHTQATTRVTDGLRRANERGWKLAQLGHVSVRRFLEEPFNDDTAAKEETFSKNDLIRNTQPSDWTCYGGISCAATVCCLQRGWIRATCQVKRADPRYFSLRATQRPIHGGGLHVLLSVRLRRLLNVQPRLPLPSHPFLVMDDVVSIGWSRRLSDARRAASIQSREPRERRRGRSTPRENLRGGTWMSLTRCSADDPHPICAGF